MSTQQKIIRDAFVALITAEVAVLVAEEHIFRSPERDLADKEYPALCIFSHGDRPSNPDDDQRFPHQRIYTLRVEGVAHGRPQEDATDPLAKAVRKAVLSDDTLQGLVMGITWDNQIWGGSEGENVAQAVTALDFNVHYLFQPE